MRFVNKFTGNLTPGFIIIALGLVGLSVSCTEDPLALDRDTAPGATSETRDITLAVTALPLWRDTTVSGFALPANAPFVFLSNDAELLANGLGRLNIPDTIRTFADTLPVGFFDSVTVQLQVDTFRSEFSGFPVTFRMLTLTESFDEDSVTWQQAAPGLPWTTPGGSLGSELATGELDGTSDTVRMEFSVSTDSLLKSWQERDGDPGFALLVEGPTARVRLQQILLRYRPLLQGREVPLVPREQSPSPHTFVTDPSPPPPGQELRLGGLPASRVYFEFVPPDTVAGIPLREATINHAEVILHPLPAPPDPFPAEFSLVARQITLLGDPFVLGPKTPIGSGNAALISLNPDTLAAGRPLSLDITLLLTRATVGSVSNIRMGLRPDPDAQTIGFWEFGSAEGPEGFIPQFRIILSPRPVFDIP